MITAIVVLTILIVVAAVWGARHVTHPETAAGHGEPEVESPSERLYRGTDAPAGPDAEDPGPFDPLNPERPVPPPP